jgi:hypothetical protein
MDWNHGPSSRMPALQMQRSEFKPQSQPKKKKKKRKKEKKKRKDRNQNGLFHRMAVRIQ